LKTIELDKNGDPVATVLTDTVISQYINEFVSNKSQIETLISNNYNISIDVNENSILSLIYVK
jgi:hypothetical protein